MPPKLDRMDSQLIAKNRNTKGFTLVEIMVVVVVIAILAAIAIPTFMNAQMASRAAKFANDLKKLSAAVTQYNMEYGEWAGDGLPGTTPNYSLTYGGTGEGFISSTAWTSETAIGGRWDWEGLGTGSIGISCRGYSATDEQIEKIDSLIDDGDINAGAFTKVDSLQLYLSLE
ncbi:MAG: prepilin-type N-terminal cleavage/methylation domain-containing protein [Verrucomicrobiota bacterium]